MSTTHAKHGGANVRVPPPLVFLIAIGAGAALQHFVPLALGLPRLPCAIAGAAIGLVGLAFGGSAAVIMRRSGQDPAPWKPSPSLLLKGPYRFSRNPMYVGMVSIAVGLGLALSNPWMMGLGLAAL